MLDDEDTTRDKGRAQCQRAINPTMLTIKTLLAIALLQGSLAFVPAPTTRTTSPSALFALDRRHVLATAAAAAIGTAAVAQPVAALDDSGKLVELTIANLNDGTSGVVKLQLKSEWAPKGVARFEELVQNGFYQDCRMFRVLPGFVAQFGINGDPAIQAKYRSANIADDPVKVSNTRGTVVFATAGPNTRTTQIFINTRADGNGFLDRQGFSPFGEVVEGMDVVDKFFAGYGEGAPSGKGPNQGLIQAKGNAYLESSFPQLSYISSAKFI